jgi:hypothetical protein
MAKQMTDSNSSPTHEQISSRAYEIFIERGQPAGQDQAHWLEAEKQLRASGQSQSDQTKQQAKPVAASTPQLSTDVVRATQPATSNGNGGQKAPAATKAQTRAGARK